MMPFPPVDIILLESEWRLGPRGFALVCTQGCIHPKHVTDCIHDLALAERGFPGQPERNQAREKIRQARLLARAAKK